MQPCDLAKCVANITLLHKHHFVQNVASSYTVKWFLNNSWNTETEVSTTNDSQIVSNKKTQGYHKKKARWYNCTKDKQQKQNILTTSLLLSRLCCFAAMN